MVSRVYESKLVMDLRRYHSRFPWIVTGSNGYPYGGFHSKADAQEIADSLEKGNMYKARADKIEFFVANGLDTLPD